MQMREKLARGMNKLEQQSGLMGVGGEQAGWGQDSADPARWRRQPLGRARQTSLRCLEEVSDDLAETKITIFNKFVKIRKLI